MEGVSVTIPPRQPKATTCWRKVVVAVDRTKSKARAFIGTPVKAGATIRVNRGAVIVSYDSTKIGRFTDRKIAVYLVRENGKLDEQLFTVTWLHEPYIFDKVEELLSSAKLELQAEVA